MTLKLVAPQTLSEKIKEDIIKFLEEALEEVKNDKVSEVILIMKRPDSSWIDRRSGSTNFPDAIGRLEIVKHAWILDYLGHKCE